MSRTLMNAAAVAGAAMVLVLAVWIDTSVFPAAQQQSAATFDLSGVVTLSSVGSVAVAGGCLAVAWLGSRAAPVVGLLYVVVGGFLALLPWLTITFAAQVNGEPPVAPEPLAQALSEIYSRTQGPLNAVGVIGGAMLLGGLVGATASLRRRGSAAAARQSPHLEALDP